VVYFEAKRYQAALAAFQHAEQLDPSQPDAHYRLARTYLTLGQKQKAQQEFDKTKALHSKNDESLIAKMSASSSGSGACCVP
jgi:Tfp pilus assembly protein PilF